MTVNEAAIKVEDISKCYRIGLQEKLHDTFGATIIDILKSPLENYRKYRSLYNFEDFGFSNGKPETRSDIIWALKNVSFEVKAGDVLGVVGKNGAGKSTLLKILSKITAPTRGRAEIRGRISSLLEVGTGFHPELTGRENIYLNGTVLGMRKREIDRKFDEIVSFSGVEKFIDTPIKRYSSGMTVRLAFSVAAHLDPEILIIDEVLAVGDSEFQKKCLGKMQDISTRGRTVLFVSHNMRAVSELCNRCIMISGGEIAAEGDTAQIVDRYLSRNSNQGSIDLRKRSDVSGPLGLMNLLYLETRDEYGNIRAQFAYREPVFFAFGVAGRPAAEIIIGLTIRDGEGNIILHFSNTDDFCHLVFEGAEAEIVMCLPENLLNDGTYYVTLWLGDRLNIRQDLAYNCLSFIVATPGAGLVKCASRVRLSANWEMKNLLAEAGGG